MAGGEENKFKEEAGGMEFEINYETILSLSLSSSLSLIDGILRISRG